nr:23S rRNA (adenine(2030)-N(6))-methyltransferase RlmJ [Litorivivens lipolytica]
MECVAHLQKKDKPFDYIDTHAGAGLYRLDSDAARKTGEAVKGVLKLDWDAMPELSLLQDNLRDDLKNQRYPGSPLLVSRLLRPGDKAWLCDLHPSTLRELEQHCGQRKGNYVRKEDGFKALPGLLPTASRRALVLIDPSYEVKSDYQTVVKVATSALHKMAQTQVLIWYPVVDRERINQLEKDVKRAGLRNSHLFEIGVADDDKPGMTSSGLIAVNPSWTAPERFKTLAPKLSSTLTEDGKARWRYQVLVPE